MVWALIVLAVVSGSLGGWMISGFATQAECLEEANLNTPWLSADTVYWDCVMTNNPQETFEKILYGY